jgi:hypothetical protein
VRVSDTGVGRFEREVWRLSLLLVLAVGMAGAQEEPGARAEILFPEPFLVEHFVIQEDPDGARTRTEPVTDYYGGHWIVSVRSDGSRLVVDLQRQELTEVRPSEGVYWSVGFGRFAELLARLQPAPLPAASRAATTAGSPVRASAASAAGGGAGALGGAAPSLVVTELSPTTDDPDVRGGSPARSAAAAAASRRADEGLRDDVASTLPGVRRLLVARVARDESAESASRAGSPPSRGTGVEVWVHPDIALSRAAVEAFERFEIALGGGSAGAGADTAAPLVRDYLHAARRFAAGALAVRTRRPFDLSTGRGRVEDVATRVEPISAFPTELAAVPDGLRRAPHPLELAAAAAAREAELDRRSGGLP